MANTPWYQGDTQPIWTLALTPDSGPFVITGLSTSNFALLLRNTDTLVDTNGTGAFSNLTAAVMNGNTVTAPASIQYQLSSADVATPGNFALYLVVTYPGGGVETFSLGPWQVVVK